MATKYPIILVHGLSGFTDIAKFPYFYGISEALKKDGHSVHLAALSAFNSNEKRGEQLWEFVQTICRKEGCDKVNLIGHSQGPLACRYVAANHPESIASVTSINGTNRGSEVADLVRKIIRKDGVPEIVSNTVMSAIGSIISEISGSSELPQNWVAALEGVTTENVELFNQKYPQGLPTSMGGEGEEVVNGVHYYSFGSYIQGLWIGERGNTLDPTHAAMRVLSAFNNEKHNDGVVGRLSMRLGKVIKDNYAQDHIDMVNHVAGLVGGNADIVGIYTKHARFLASKSL